MKQLLLLGLFIGFSATSFAAGFHYNAKTGKCVNSKGREGYNRVEETNLLMPADFVEVDDTGVYYTIAFRDRNLECTDLRNINIDALIRKPEYGTNYLTLENWNLKGALLEGAKIAWSVGNICAEGAKLTGILGGYVMVTTTYDKFTQGLNQVQCPALRRGSADCDWRF
jgi:hypothetical protein